MKNLIYLFVFSFSLVSVTSAQIPGKFFGVLEVKHSSRVDLSAYDQKTIEINGIGRKMFSSSIGASVVARLNDTSSNILAGVTFLPAKWVRFDILGGVAFYSVEKKSLIGGRLWLGNELISFFANADGGTANFWGEMILLVTVAPWVALGGMANTTGYGPRAEITPICNFKIWAGATGDWRNKIGQGEGYKAKNVFAHVGAKIIF